MKYNGVELEPVKEIQAFEEPKRMLVWNEGSVSVETRLVAAIAIIKSYRKALKVVCYDYDLYDYCAEIPQPQTREMTSLEVMEYLHLFQLYLDNGGQGNPTGIALPIVNDRNASDYKFGLIVFKNNNVEDDYKWLYITYLNSFSGNDFKFGILKNGKVTEFELPQIEVKNE